MKKLKILSLMILALVAVANVKAVNQTDEYWFKYHRNTRPCYQPPTSSNVPDAGSTAAMLGLTMVGLYMVGRKNLKKHA